MEADAQERDHERERHVADAPGKVEGEHARHEERPQARPHPVARVQPGHSAGGKVAGREGIDAGVDGPAAQTEDHGRGPESGRDREAQGEGDERAVA
jgi:hypothetical protein